MIGVVAIHFGQRTVVGRIEAHCEAEDAPRRRPMTTLLLGDAFAHHIWATERLGVTLPELDVWAFARATGRERAEHL